MVLTFKSVVDIILTCEPPSNQNHRAHFPLVHFIALYKVVVRFVSADKTLKGENSKSYFLFI